MNVFVAELVGTAILIIFGDGVVANVVLARTKGYGSGWIVITFGWGMGVFVAVFCVAAYSGAHINPAVTLGMAVAGKLAWSLVPIYMIAQVLGGLLGGIIVFAFYRDHFAATEDADLKLACFCTGPNIRNYPLNFFCEVVGTFLLVFPIFLMADPADIRAIPMVRSPHTGGPTLFLYDTYPGGVGFARKLFDLHDLVLDAAAERLARCACPQGCPSCVGSALEAGPVAKASTARLLQLAREESEARGIA